MQSKRIKLTFPYHNVYKLTAACWFCPFSVKHQHHNALCIMITGLMKQCCLPHTWLDRLSLCFGRDGGGDISSSKGENFTMQKIPR